MLEQRKMPFILLSTFQFSWGLRTHAEKLENQACNQVVQMLTDGRVSSITLAVMWDWVTVSLGMAFGLSPERWAATLQMTKTRNAFSEEAGETSAQRCKSTQHTERTPNGLTWIQFKGPGFGKMIKNEMEVKPFLLANVLENYSVLMLQLSHHVFQL